ncbi:MAG: T9SS type A sorting domain-containing protein [Rhodothermales bacterium]|nr:T9SS type A sorting domain-containing protein [Rhodothermales bacterium]
MKAHLLFVALTTMASLAAAQPYTKLFDPNPPNEAVFGKAIVFSEGELLIGSAADTEKGAYAGVVHVYSIVDGDWQETDRIMDPTGQAGDVFGAAMDTQDSLLVVAGYTSDFVHLYVRRQGRWVAKQVLIERDTNTSDFWGPVAIMGDFIFVATIGKRFGMYSFWDGGEVVVFKREGDEWRLSQRLSASAEIEGFDGSYGSPFCVAGDVLVVGAHRDFEGGDWAGAAYVYVLENGVWSEQEKTVSPSIEAYDQFGRMLGCSPDEVVISSYKAHKMRRLKSDGGIWTEQDAGVTPPSSPQASTFLTQIAFAADRLFIGGEEQFGDSLSYVGTLYEYAREGDDWVLEHTWNAPEPSQGDGYGYVLAVDENYVAVSAQYEDREWINPIDGTMRYGDEVGSVIVYPRADFLATTVEDLPSTHSAVTRLQPPFPNPSRERTTLTYSVDLPSRVVVRIVDTMGRAVVTLIDQTMSTGKYSIAWDGRLSDGRQAPSGVYLVEMIAGQEREVRKVVLVR